MRPAQLVGLCPKLVRAPLPLDVSRTALRVGEAHMFQSTLRPSCPPFRTITSFLKRHTPHVPNTGTPFSLAPVAPHTIPRELVMAQSLVPRPWSPGHVQLPRRLDSTISTSPCEIFQSTATARTVAPHRSRWHTSEHPHDPLLVLAPTTRLERGMPLPQKHGGGSHRIPRVCLRLPLKPRVQLAQQSPRAVH